MNRPSKQGHQKNGRRRKRQASDQPGAPPRQRARFEQPLQPPQWPQQKFSQPPPWTHQLTLFSSNNNAATSWRQPSFLPFGLLNAQAFVAPPVAVAPPPFAINAGTSWLPPRADFPPDERQPPVHAVKQEETSWKVERGRAGGNMNRDIRRAKPRPTQPARRPKVIDGEEPGEIISDYEEEEEEEVEEEAVRDRAGIGKRYVELDPDARKTVEERLRRELGLAEGQVPEFVLRMREMGPMAYPPALIDRHVRVNETPAFFGGTVENILPKRRIAADTLPAFRGFTHVRGERVDPAFIQMMSELAAADHQLATQDSLERSGLEELREGDEQEADEKRKSTEIVHFDVPQYEVGESAGYFVATQTKTMSHTIEGFATGIQPFEHSTPTQPTGFLRRLRALVNNHRPAARGVDVQMEEGELE
ncbi:hypothetical protein M3Y99_00511300 [Aphelenchoides fujianensis]|nr:hypothetical protein M3Y99_01615500 [Aphelenchoides fujianensis]KAI6239971.1 hypothetical protein M3Y99_00511300 [Aphelenchoides fujianensis]